MSHRVCFMCQCQYVPYLLKWKVLVWSKMSYNLPARLRGCKYTRWPDMRKMPIKLPHLHLRLNFNIHLMHKLCDTFPLVQLNMPQHMPLSNLSRYFRLYPMPIKVPDLHLRHNLPHLPVPFHLPPKPVPYHLPQQLPKRQLHLPTC
jgi:hypothetical protein